MIIIYFPKSLCAKKLIIFWNFIETKFIYKFGCTSSNFPRGCGN